MKNNSTLFCILALILVSCQKELSDNNPPLFWAVTNITITNADTKVELGAYNFEYDSVLRRATKLSFQNIALGVSRNIFPRYVKDTVYLLQNSYLALDASKRIKVLSEFSSAQGVVKGAYFYNYNGQGQLEERLLDDGVGDAIRTTFNYDNGELVKYNKDFKGFPLASIATLTYLSSPRINGFGQYSLLEIFPELLLYMPCLNIGKPVIYPVSQIVSELAVPGVPTPGFTTQYSNSILTAEGYISSFQTHVQIGSLPPVNTLYRFTYRSFK